MFGQQTRATVIASAALVVATAGIIVLVDRPAAPTADSEVGQSERGFVPESAAPPSSTASVEVTSTGIALVPLNAVASSPMSSTGIPARALAAYRAAALTLQRTAPRCNLDWPLLAGIGKVESDHARGGSTDQAGTATPRIYGPALDGRPGFAAIPDTDGGTLDADPTWDRAVGPMQFIPSTWRKYAADGNGDRRTDPQNLFDAALAAGNYLCAGGRDVGGGAGRREAVLSYNNSESYLKIVLLWSSTYASSAVEIPGATNQLVLETPSIPPTTTAPSSTTATTAPTTTSATESASSGATTTTTTAAPPAVSSTESTASSSSEISVTTTTTATGPPPVSTTENTEPTSSGSAPEGPAPTATTDPSLLDTVVTGVVGLLPLG